MYDIVFVLPAKKRIQTTTRQAGLKFFVHASDDWHEPTTKTKKSESSEKSNTRHNPEQYKTQLPPPQLYSIYMYIYIA